MKTATLASEGLWPRKDISTSFPRNLARAILLQAFRDAIPLNGSPPREWNSWRQDAIAWFFSDTTHPGSLSWICEILQLKPWTLRQWLITYERSPFNRKAEMATTLFRYLRSQRIINATPGSLS